MAAFGHVANVSTVTVEEAQNTLTALAKRALRGERILIQLPGEESLVALERVTPELPPNYLADCYGPDEIQVENALASLAPRGTST